MPTYEYACTKCGQHVEVFQRVSDEPLTTCGVCGGPLRKVFHPAGILFKGSGFYSTDSRSSGDGSKKHSETSSGDKTSKEKRSDSSSESSSGSASGGSSDGKAKTSSSEASSSSSSSSGSAKERSA